MQPFITLHYLKSGKTTHMKKLILLSTFLSASFLILYSEIGAPPVDSVGAPPSGASCTKSGCHTGSTVEDAAKFTLRLSETEIGLADSSSIVNNHNSYVSGQTYYGSLALSSGAAVYGFQLLALNQSNSQAGSFSVTDATHTRILTAGTRQYIGHKNANSNSEFHFQWTAPSVTEDVTFYYASVFGNGNNQNSGDNVYKSASVVHVVGTSDLIDIPSVKNFNVYPTQTFSDIAVKFNTTLTQSAQITLVDMSGKVVKTLYNGQLSAGENEFLFNLSEVSQGNYILSIQGSKTRLAKHISRL